MLQSNIPHAFQPVSRVFMSQFCGIDQVEPIQAEAGIIIPNEGYASTILRVETAAHHHSWLLISYLMRCLTHRYIAEVQRVCKKHNVLLIVDEVQTGIGRTGKVYDA